jgi:murein DD-endopeptidase MepM/ murein hydrolase activator NlpD
MDADKLSRRAFLKAGAAVVAAAALSAALPASSEAVGLADPYSGVVPMTFPIRRGLYWNARNWHVPRVGSILNFNHENRAWLRAHDGIDIFAPKHTPMYASVSGKIVEYPRPRYLYGNYVWILGDNGYRFFYCHLDKVAVKIGQRVDTHTLLGTVGNTGNAATTPSHLHFELHMPPGNVYTCKYCGPHKGVSSMNPTASLAAAAIRA